MFVQKTLVASYYAKTNFEAENMFREHDSYSKYMKYSIVFNYKTDTYDVYKLILN